MREQILSSNCPIISIGNTDYAVSERVLYVERVGDPSEYKSFDNLQEFYDYVTNMQLTASLDRAKGSPNSCPAWLKPTQNRTEPSASIWIAGTEFYPIEDLRRLEHSEDRLTREFESKQEYYDFLAYLNLRLVTSAEECDLSEWTKAAEECPF